MKNPKFLEALTSRRSVLPTMFLQEGPNGEEIEQILRVAMRVPDHKKLAPWRFIVFSGQARAKMGEVFARACQAEDEQQPSEVRLQTERERFMRAPVVIAVISKMVEHPNVPAWEQTQTAGIAGYNLCLAANCLGYGTCLLTEWIAYSPYVNQALKLSYNERVASFVYVGRVEKGQEDRVRPDFEDKVMYWDEA